jgi:hypothetical protein
VLSELLEIGERLWTTLAEIREGHLSLDHAPYDAAFSPLCDYCHFNKDCPKFSGETNVSLDSELVSLAGLKSSKTKLEDEIHERENQLKALAFLMGKENQWITSGQHRFKVSTQKGRRTLDPELLKHNLIKAIVGLDEASVNEVLFSSQKEGQPFERFNLCPVK